METLGHYVGEELALDAEREACDGFVRNGCVHAALIPIIAIVKCPALRILKSSACAVE